MQEQEADRERKRETPKKVERRDGGAAGNPTEMMTDLQSPV